MRGCIDMRPTRESGPTATIAWSLAQHKTPHPHCSLSPTRIYPLLLSHIHESIQDFHSNPTNLDRREKKKKEKKFLWQSMWTQKSSYTSVDIKSASPSPCCSAHLLSFFSFLLPSEDRRRDGWFQISWLFFLNHSISTAYLFSAIKTQSFYQVHRIEE